MTLGRQVDRPFTWAVVLIACLVPLVSFAFASRGAWLLDYGWQDNWSYLKYFHDWNTSDPILRDFMDRDYKGARVAWILPGFLVYHTLGPLAANVTFNFLVAAVSVLLTFGLAARLFGRSAGAAAAIVASAFPVFYASGFPHAWSYQGSICNVFYLGLLWSLAEHARGTRPKQWALLAGVAGTLTLLTGTTYLVTLPWALAFWLILRGRPSLTEIVVAGGLGGVGALLTVGILAGVTALAGGSPLFMLPLVRKSVGVVDAGFFGGTVESWLPRASWLAFPSIVLLGGTITSLILAPPGRLLCRETRPFVAAFVGFAGLWLTMILLETTVQAYVQYEHYNYTITGPAAIALAGILRWLPRQARSGAQESPSRPVVILPLLAGLVVLPQTLLDPTLVAAITEPVTRALSDWSLPGTVVVSLLVASIGLAFVMLGAWHTLLSAGLCFGVACALTNPSAAPFHLSPTCSVERDNYLLVTDVTRWLASEGRHVNTRSWYPPSDLLARPDGCGDYELVRTFQAIEQAGMLWKINLQLPARIADLSQYEVRNIAEKPRAHLIIFSQPQKAQTYNRELAEWGRTSGVNPVPRPVEQRTFRRGSLSVTVQVYRLREPQRS